MGSEKGPSVRGSSVPPPAAAATSTPTAHNARREAVEALDAMRAIANQTHGTDAVLPTQAAYAQTLALIYIGDQIAYLAERAAQR